MYNPYFHILEKNPCKNKIKLVFDLIYENKDCTYIYFKIKIYICTILIFIY